MLFLLGGWEVRQPLLDLYLTQLVIESQQQFGSQIQYFSESATIWILWSCQLSLTFLTSFLLSGENMVTTQGIYGQTDMSNFGDGSCIWCLLCVLFWCIHFGLHMDGLRRYSIIMKVTSCFIHNLNLALCLSKEKNYVFFFFQRSGMNLVDFLWNQLERTCSKISYSSASNWP